jgi:hypothetical protein
MVSNCTGSAQKQFTWSGPGASGSEMSSGTAGS